MVGNGFIIEYRDEEEFRKREKAVKKNNMLAYKKLMYLYYPDLKKGNFAGNLISSNEIDKVYRYKLVLPTDKVFLLKYEEISLEYTVYLNRRIIVLDELNPCELLDNLLDNYDIKKDKNVSGEFSYDKMFKINLIDLMGEDEE